MGAMKTDTSEHCGAQWRPDRASANYASGPGRRAEDGTPTDSFGKVVTAIVLL